MRTWLEFTDCCIPFRMGRASLKIALPQVAGHRLVDDPFAPLPQFCYVTSGERVRWRVPGRPDVVVYPFGVRAEETEVGRRQLELARGVEP